MLIDFKTFYVWNLFKLFRISKFFSLNIIIKIQLKLAINRKQSKNTKQSFISTLKHKKERTLSPLPFKKIKNVK